MNIHIHIHIPGPARILAALEHAAAALVTRLATAPVCPPAWRTHPGGLGDLSVPAGKQTP